MGLAHFKGGKNDYEQFLLTNFTTLKNLLSELRKNNKIPSQIIYTSTISVYGESYSGKLFAEDAQKKPFSAYAKTKLLCENYLLKNFKKQSWILRLAPVYSNTFLLNINRRTKFFKFFYRVGAGENRLSLCNIENIGLTIKSIINQIIPYGIYNIADDKIYTYNDLLCFKKSSSYIIIPPIIIKGFYYFGKFLKINYLRENSIKLLTNNIYPVGKINKFIRLSFKLF